MGRLVPGRDRKLTFDGGKRVYSFTISICSHGRHFQVIDMLMNLSIFVYFGATMVSGNNNEDRITLIILF